MSPLRYYTKVQSLKLTKKIGNDKLIVDYMGYGQLA